MSGSSTLTQNRKALVFSFSNLPRKALRREWSRCRSPLLLRVLCWQELCRITLAAGDKGGNLKGRVVMTGRLHRVGGAWQVTI